MQLTGKSIVMRNIVSNYADNAVQQQGVDVRIDKVYKVCESGIIPVVGKTILPSRVEILPEGSYEYGDKEVFELEPGYYEIELMESCKIPDDAVLNYKSRSSLVRCGSHVFSGQFDGGFETDKMGCYMLSLLPIQIEKGSRIAQAIVTETEKVEKNDLYNGQFQNDKQRK